jgi:hypothetical protein
LKIGDEVVAYGRYIGRSPIYVKHPELDVIELASATDDAGPALVAKRGVEPGTYPDLPPPNASPGHPAAAERTVEHRLEELNSLKSKGLITDDEYKQQRDRILGSL